MRAVLAGSRSFARWQSTTAGAGATKAASTGTGAVAPVAQSSAVKLPVLTSAEAYARGNTVSDPAARFSIEDTSSINLAEAKTVAILSDVTEEMAGRRAIIFKKGQSAMTSGTGASKHWAIRMNNVDKWDNQLMGWVSSTDTLQTPMSQNIFDSVEQAVFFCERNGIAWEVQESTEHAPVATDGKSLGNQYSYNFLTLEVQANMKRRGARRGRHIFTHPESPTSTGVSTWVNWRKTDHGPDAWRPRQEIGQGQTAWTGPDWAPTKKEGGEHH